MRKLALAALLLTASFNAPAASAQQGQITAGAESQIACRSQARDDQPLYGSCMFHEYQAANTLTRIVAAVPEWMIYACNRKSKNRGDDFSRNSLSWMLDCFNAELEDLPESRLPSGSATLYDAGIGRRYWTLKDCQQARKDGQVCSFH